MAKLDYSNNHLPVFHADMEDGAIVRLTNLNKIKIGKDAYAIGFAGTCWTGEFEDGDFVLADPSAEIIPYDYVVIWLIGNTEPVIEQMALSYMQGSIGKTPQPESNAAAVFSIRRTKDSIAFIRCEKIEKVHKVIGRLVVTEIA